VRIYISHTVGCTGWDMPSIYKGTNFAMACRTSRFQNHEEGEPIKMLDWDYKQWVKDPEKIEQKHLELAREHDFEVVMSMDLWKTNIPTALAYCDELKQYCDKVLIPAHYFPEELLGYELAYPNANWFAQNVFPPGEFRPFVKHILGGSPHSQLKLLQTTQRDLYNYPLRFPNVESIDGNQIFNVAIKTAKSWFPKKPHWVKVCETNLEAFELSVHQVNQAVEAFL
jgi:hypothetical protein